MMNIHRLTTTNLPSIRIHDHPSSFDPSFDEISSARTMRSQPRDIPFKHSSPIAIAGSFNPNDVPPPLLPIHPIHPTDWNNRSEHGSERHGTPKSPLEMWGSGSMRRGYLGSHGSRKGGWDSKRQDENLREAHSGLENMHIEDRPSNSLPSEESLRKEAMSASMSAYDRDLLRKLGSNQARSNQRIVYSPIDDGLASAESEPARRSGWNFTPTSSFTPASSPIGIGSRSSESPMDRWPIGGSRRDPKLARMAFSPEQHPPVFPASMDYRNSGSDSASLSSLGHNDDCYGDSVRSPITGWSSLDNARGRLPIRPRKSYDRMGRMDDDLAMEDIPSSQLSGLRRLNLGSETPPRPNSYPVLSSNSNQRAGSKRRASSPPIGDGPVAQSEPTRKNTYDGSEGPHRRSPNAPHPSAARYSPGMGSKFYPSLVMHNASTGSSFASSTGTGWSNSYSSHVSLATNYSTQECSSPGASFSPQSDPETPSDSPYMNNPNPRRGNRQRAAQDLQTTSLPDRDVMPQKLSPVHKLNGVYMCDCCPKKPKKFDTKAELQIHEMEKQYTCNFCSNRFKNKNEAERHQNSLHLRKHSWSCAALSGAEAAFHPSSQRAGADVCGYCGKEFTGPESWDIRREHLITEHKFGECNQGKKFFRADHFRQHLKHSHSGTTGKWTNVLENACMRDEPGVDGSHGIIGHENPAISEE